MDAKITPLTKEQWIERARLALIKHGFNDVPSMASWAKVIMESCDSDAVTPEQAVASELNHME